MAIAPKDYDSLEALNHRIFDLIDIIKKNIYVYPEISMNCARQIAEAICAKTILRYNLTSKFPTEFKGLLTVLSNYPEKMPPKRCIDADTLREWGNAGSHFRVTRMNPKETITALSALDNLLEWWFTEENGNPAIPMQYLNLSNLPLSAPADLNEPCRSVSVNDKTSDYRLLSTPSLITKPVFCGRMDTLSEIFIKFQHEGERVIFLHGIGGIGKTQIAKQYAKQFKRQYDTIIYATYNKNLKELILSDSYFKFEPRLTRFTLSDGTLESDDSFYERKLALLKECTDDRTLIIIDNFDTESDDYLFDLLEGNYHLLFTTRCDYSQTGLSIIKINPIASVDDLISIFMQNYGKGSRVRASDPDLLELLELVSRHTYTIELLAQHMRRSNQTAAEMAAALREKGITSLNQNVKNDRLQTRKAYENLLKMFSIFALNENERRVLMYLSIMPLEGVSDQDFIAWSKLEDADILISLEERSWILLNPGGIALHPIIREVLHHELPANEHNCSEFIQCFCDSIDEVIIWHAEKETKDRYASIARELLSYFRTPTPMTEQLYAYSTILFSFAVDPDYAIVVGKQLFDYRQNTYGINTYETMQIAFRIGWTYAYNLHLPNALDEGLHWLSLTHEHLSPIQKAGLLTTNKQLATWNGLLCNLAKMYLLRYNKIQNDADYEQAMMYAAANLEFTKTSFTAQDIHYSRIGGAHLQIADVLLARNEYGQALEHVDKALDLLYSIHQIEEDSDYSFGLSRKAAALYGLGDYSEAEKIVSKGIEGYSRFFGENNTEIYQMYLQRGAYRTALNKFGKARADYKKAESILKTIYAPGSPQFALVAKKLEKLDAIEPAL